jgi:hypothetical protein
MRAFWRRPLEASPALQRDRSHQSARLDRGSKDLAFASHASIRHRVRYAAAANRRRLYASIPDDTDIVVTQLIGRLLEPLVR